MPTVLNSCQFKTIGSTTPGELFRINLGGSLAVCLNLELYEGSVIVGILKSPLIKTPSYYRNNSPDQACFSYGCHWLLDVHLGDESFPINSYAEIKPRTLYLQNNFAILRMSKFERQAGYDDVDIDILGAGQQPVKEPSVPVMCWSIWANEADRKQIGAIPVVQFEASAK